MKARKKPLVIEAQQWNDIADLPEIVKRFPEPVESSAFCKECGDLLRVHGSVKTLEGWHIVCPGDWIICGVKGEYYPCKPDIFEMTYESVEDSDEEGRHEEHPQENRLEAP